MVYDQEGSWLADLYDADYEALRTPSGDVDFYVEEARNAGGPVVEFGMTMNIGASNAVS